MLNNINKNGYVHFWCRGWVSTSILKINKYCMAYVFTTYVCTKSFHKKTNFCMTYVKKRQILVLK
jgi:hypothetical protein